MAIQVVLFDPRDLQVSLYVVSVESSFYFSYQVLSMNYFLFF